MGSDLHRCVVRPHIAAPQRAGMIVYVDAAESFIASTAAVLGKRGNRCSIMASRVGGVVLPGADLRGAAVPPGGIAAGVVRGVALPSGAVLDGRAEILDPLHVAVVDVAGAPGGVTVFRTATGAPVCSRPEWEQHPKVAAAAAAMLAGVLPDPLTAGPAPHDLPGMAVPAGRSR